MVQSGELSKDHAGKVQPECEKFYSEQLTLLLFLPFDYTRHQYEHEYCTVVQGPIQDTLNIFLELSLDFLGIKNYMYRVICIFMIVCCAADS